MPYADRWRRHRRWFQNTLLARNALNAYEPLQRDELQKLLRDLLRDPGEALAHLKRYAAALMLGVAYGYSPSTMDDEFVRMTEEAMHLALDGGGPGSALVDFFPARKSPHIPPTLLVSSVLRRDVVCGELSGGVLVLRSAGYKEMHRIPLERAAGTARPCVATALLEEAARDGIVEKADEDEISSALGVMYVAGTDTTSAVLVAFVLAMVLHPDVLRKAQAEVDSVVGDGRLPEPDDRAALPYLEAVLKEVYRWLAPAPLGTPHELTEHDEYAGFHMPKGALIVTNIWAMSRDEQYFTDPDRFDPERFLDVGADAGEAMDPRKFVFGFGRRICPGRVLADQSIFIVAATLVAAFDIRPARTPDGNEIPLKSRSRLEQHPKPFVCDISPRSGKADLILGTANGNGVKY
ncbi:cytochrome P450 [Fomitopsis serialis]|uniref:cytochrome P450 n=1 Tax=Fomitopsis serialis TaxID=139415 RepID=UPI002007A0F7|nr:cytochrome P450 [Neoantrodia serialis]KAH9917063.1 cytochrome P450 [Neoantrodia serialis]